MANSFGTVFYIDSQNGAPPEPGFGPSVSEYLQIQGGQFGPSVSQYLQVPEGQFGPSVNVLLEAASEFGFGPPTNDSIPQFTVGIPPESNVIQSTENSSLNVTNLTIADKTGSGNPSWSTPSNSSTQLNGFGFNTESKSSSYTLPLEKSGRLWTNSVSEIVASLPSGAPNGWFAIFKQTAGGLIIQPGSNDKLVYGDDTIVKSNGVSGRLASSGAFLCLMANENSDWVAIMSGGMIS